MSKYAFTRAAYRILKYVQRQTTLGRKQQFDYFNHRILKETTTVYHSFEELKKNPPQADLYIVGSDQIWNVFYEAGRDPAFFLDWVKEGKKAIHIGGTLQLYFGIKGKRWTNCPFYNEYWVEPSANEKPKNLEKVEGGCYW